MTTRTNVVPERPQPPITIGLCDDTYGPRRLSTPRRTVYVRMNFSSFVSACMLQPGEMRSPEEKQAAKCSENQFLPASPIPNSRSVLGRKRLGNGC
jgi:hypothetical protein